MKKAIVDVNKYLTLTGHKDCVYTINSSPIEKRIISAGGDGLVAEWELDGNENGQLVAQVPNSVYAICPIPETTILIVGQNYEGIHLIDVAEKKEISSLHLGKQAIFDIFYLNKHLFIGDSTGTITVVDLDSLTIQAKIRKSDKSVRTIISKGKELAAGYSDNIIRIFDLKSLELIQELTEHTKSVFSLKYSPGGKYLLSGSRDAHLKIWTTNGQYELKEDIIAHMYAINSVVYSPDGRNFATCSMDKTVKIWDAETFKLLKVIDKTRHGGHTTSVNKLFWSNYKNRLISCSDDRSIAIWDLNFRTQA